MPQMSLFEGPDEVLWGQCPKSSCLNKAAATSLNKDKAVRAHKTLKMRGKQARAKQ